MDIEQAKTKLNNVTKSIATKYPNVLVSELCSVVKFLLDEIERIKSPPMTILETIVDKLPPADPFVISPPPPPDKPYIPPTTTDVPPTTTWSDDQQTEK